MPGHGIIRPSDFHEVGTPDEPLLFKPTLADVIRLD